MVIKVSIKFNLVCLGRGGEYCNVREIIYFYFYFYFWGMQVMASLSLNSLSWKGVEREQVIGQRVGLCEVNPLPAHETMAFSWERQKGKKLKPSLLLAYALPLSYPAHSFIPHWFHFPVVVSPISEGTPCPGNSTFFFFSSVKP